jgi:hypothetical protein
VNREIGARVFGAPSGQGAPSLTLAEHKGG